MLTKKIFKIKSKQKKLKTGFHFTFLTRLEQRLLNLIAHSNPIFLFHATNNKYRNLSRRRLRQFPVSNCIIKSRAYLAGYVFLELTQLWPYLLRTTPQIGKRGDRHERCSES